MTLHAASSASTDRISAWFSRFEAALQAGNLEQAADLFQPDCHWRDFVAFSWNIVTVEGQAGVAKMLRSRLGAVAPVRFTAEPAAAAQGELCEGFFEFSCALGQGNGYIRLRGDRCWTLLTALTGLAGFEEAAGERRPKGVAHGATRNRLTWQNERAEHVASFGHSKQPYCLIIGGGQGGIGLAARLKRLDVPTLVVDIHPRPGDAWRSRYESLYLHDPVWYDHLPYLPFPDHWPEFTHKDKMGDWLEAYTKVMELDYWGSTEARQARYDEAAGQWKVKVIREGREIELRPRHLVIATGMSGAPYVPKFPGADSFEGVQCHSSQYTSGGDYHGRRCVVIGSNNSAHDLCADLWEHGVESTMVQRSPTIVVRSETLMEESMYRLYSEQAVRSGITTERADLMLSATPFRLMPEFHRPLWKRIAERDADYYDRLRAAGFMVGFGPDEAGLYLSYMRSGSGYYVDVGASELIASGQVGLRSGVGIEAIEPRHVVLTDGSRLPADAILYATGFDNMNSWVAKLISPEVAERIGPCWGFGSGIERDPGPWEGELRNMWKPTRQPGLWFHGGSLQQSRSFSRYLALQIKARMENLPIDVYQG